MAKKNAWCNNLHTSMRAFVTGSATLLLFCLGSPTPLSSCFIPALLAYFVPALLSYSLPTLLSYSMPASLFPVHTLVIRLSFLVLISTLGTPNFLLSYLMLSLAPTHLIFLALETFKQVLLDELLYYYLTNFAKLLCLFPTFSLLPKKSKHKQLFNTTFINSCLLASNHTAKKVDLSFVLCGCSTLVKLN